MKPMKRRGLVLFFTTDFAENILLIRKHELADQYFHRIEILLFGAVVSFVVVLPVGEEAGGGGAGVQEEGGVEESSERQRDDHGLGLHQRSYMVSSDFRWLCCFALVSICFNPPGPRTAPWSMLPSGCVY